MTRFEENTVFYYETMLQQTKEIKDSSKQIATNALDMYNILRKESQEMAEETDSSVENFHQSFIRYTERDIKLREEHYDADKLFREQLLGNLNEINTNLKKSTSEEVDRQRGEFIIKFALDGADELNAKQFRYFLEELSDIDESVITSATSNIVSFFDTFTEERMEKLDNFQDQVGVISNSVETVTKAEEEAGQPTNYQNLRDFATALLMVGGSVAVFAGIAAGFKTSDIFKGLFVLTASVGILIGAVALIDKLDIKTSEVGRDLLFISGSMIAFAGAIGLVSYVTKNHIDREAMVTFGIVLGITAAGVALMGKASPMIVKGATALGIIAGTIGLFGLATSFAVSQLTEHSVGDYLTTLAVMGATAAVVAGAGFLLPFILPGAVALASMGVSLALIGVGLKSLQDVDIDPDKASNAAKSLSSFLKPYAMFGLAAPLVVLGSGAIIAASLSMMIASAALNRVPDVDEEKIEVFENSVNRMLRVVSMDPTGISNLLGRSDRPSFPEVMAGTVAIMGASAAIIGVVKAMKAALNVEISEDEWQRILSMIGRVPMLFAEVETEGGFDLFGKTIIMNDVQKGIASIMGVGQELQSIVEALVQAADVDLGDPEDPNSKFAHIQNMIAAVPGFFAGYGEGRLSFLGLTIKQSEVEKGIRAIRGSGKELLNIVKSFKEISQISDVERTSEQFAVVFSNYMDAIGKYDYASIDDRRMRRVFNTTGVLADQISVIGHFNQDGGFGKIIQDVSQIHTLNDPIIEFTEVISQMNDELSLTAGLLKNVGEENFDELAEQMEEFIKESKLFEFKAETKETDSRDNNDPRNETEGDENVNVAQLSNDLNDVKNLLQQMILAMNAQAGQTSKQNEKNSQLLAQMVNEISGLKHQV